MTVAIRLLKVKRFDQPQHHRPSAVTALGLFFGLRRGLAHSWTITNPSIEFFDVRCW